MRVCRYGLVSGIVQGVSFRAYVKQAAEGAGLGGYARNLPDGSVEVLLCGDADKVTQVEALVAKGPAAAKVTGVEWESRECAQVDGFTTGWRDRSVSL